MIMQQNARKFTESEDLNRSTLAEKIPIKVHSYYNKKDNLWNEPHRLDPKKFAKYSEKNIDPETTFKFYIRDYPKMIEHEKKIQYLKDLDKISSLRSQNKQRQD